MSEPLKVTTVFRDDRLIAVDKPSGMVVHRGWAADKETVYDIVRDTLVGQRVFAVHRLDRGTSGVLLFALDTDAAHFVQEEMLAGRVEKHYLALVRGPLSDRLFINHPVKQPPADERVEAATEVIPKGHSGRWSLVEARPITGRSHQIRIHLKHVSHPIVGDVKHGKGDVNRYFRSEHGFARLALHAWKLKLRHPAGKEILELEAPMPDDFARLLERLQLSW